MPLSMRTFVTAAIPTLAALLGILWFRRKKKPPALKPPSVENEETGNQSEVVIEPKSVCTNSAPRVYITQPSQATPLEESYDISEVIAKAVVEELPAEVPDETDSEEESVESVVTAIESSSVTVDHPSNESDVGVIEDTCANSNNSTEANPSVISDTTIEVMAPTVNGQCVKENVEHVNAVSSQTVTGGKTNSVRDSVCKEANEEKCMQHEIQEVTDNRKPQVDFEDMLVAEVEKNSLSWSDTIELAENNNTEKVDESPSVDPIHSEIVQNVNVSKVASNKACDKKSDSRKSVSASKSQEAVSAVAKGKPQAPAKQSKSATSNKANEDKKSPRGPQHNSRVKNDSRFKDQDGTQKKGKLYNSQASGDGQRGLSENSGLTGQDTNDWGNQAEALPNGVNSDAHSEISVDSGKASSASETPSTSSPNNLQDFTVFEFDFPVDYCGKLIGKMGKNIKQIKMKTGAEIYLKRKPLSKEYQICSLEGTQSQVNAALDQIKQRFPPRQYPGVSFEQINMIESPVLPPEIMQLSLPEGVSVDVIVSSVVDANHVFLQQPTHPTFSSLERLAYCMNLCYTQDNIVPQLPRPIDAGVICAAPMYQGWFRAQVVAYDEKTDECDIKFVDYGGYLRVKSSILRQIRSDFTTLPFQAVECYMAHVIPLKDEEKFAPEAAALLESLVQNQLLQAQILAHEEDGVPYVQLYKVDGEKVFFVNRELVNQNVARWLDVVS